MKAMSAALKELSAATGAEVMLGDVELLVLVATAVNVGADEAAGADGEVA